MHDATICLFQMTIADKRRGELGRPAFGSYNQTFAFCGKAPELIGWSQQTAGPNRLMNKSQIKGKN